jgi:hypothetical protein
MQKSWAKTNYDKVSSVLQLKLVINATVCRLYVPQSYTVEVLASKTAYDLPLAPTYKLIKDLQQEDAFVTS